ncbi:MAG: hypothetical protein QOG21_612 [Actinomycetota bacterium]|jgi:hypothetical protein|nr:hypothetical protein [Actinomycetota bacterium]
MATATLSHRAPDPADPFASSGLERALGHPAAYALTALILLTLFGWTFFTHPQRVAPTKDPAYYTWRTEALITEKPATLLSITGPFSVFSGGYRVSSAVLGGYLRRIAGVSQLKVTVFLVVGLPVLIALLLGGFALRQRGDPLIFHVVALGAGSLLLTPPFVGYLDNVLCLFFLAAALWFITPAGSSWPARVALGLFLLASGFTHPTTLAIFCFALAGMALVRWSLTRFDLREAIRSDGPVLAIAFAAAVVTYVAWKVGIWGRSASLSEAALAPPYGSGFFRDRMTQWLGAMHPLLNGPLFLAGVAGLIAAGKRAARDDLARVAIVWLAPLVGLFGFLASLTYPYYRFFNTTLAWILLVGLGAYFAIRFFLARAARGGLSRFAALGAVAVLAIIIVNFADGLGASGWNNPAAGWLSTSEKRDLDALRSYLSNLGQRDRPVVFVVDNKPPAPFQIYGYTKLTGNTSRYGLPEGQIDRGYLYLGSLRQLLHSRPTLTGDPTYDRLSKGFLADARRGIAASGQKPIVVLDSAFNASGANSGALLGKLSTKDIVRTLGARPPTLNADLVRVNQGAAVGASGPIASLPVQRAPAHASPWHALLVPLGLLVLLIPGLLAASWFVPGVSFAEMLGLVPALSMAFLALIGIVALAIVRSPFSSPLAWVCVGLAVVTGALLRVRSWNSLPRGRFTYGSDVS